MAYPNDNSSQITSAVPRKRSASSVPTSSRSRKTIKLNVDNNDPTGRQGGLGVQAATEELSIASTSFSSLAAMQNSFVPIYGPSHQLPLGHDFEHASGYSPIDQGAFLKDQELDNFFGAMNHNFQELQEQSHAHVGDETEGSSYFPQHSPAIGAGFEFGLLENLPAGAGIPDTGRVSVMGPPAPPAPAARVAVFLRKTRQKTQPAASARSTATQPATVNPVGVATPSPANNGHLELWDINKPTTRTEKQAAKARAGAVANGKNPNDAYGGVTHGAAPETVKLPPSLDISADETLTFLPNHLKVPAVPSRLLPAGWRRPTIAKKILSVRGRLTSEALHTTENRLQAQFKEGLKIHFGVQDFTIPKVETSVFPTVKYSTDDWHLREEYSLDHKKTKAARESYQDAYLVDLANGVPEANFPKGDQEWVLTKCIKYALKTQPSLKLSGVPATALRFGWSTPQFLINVEPDANAAAAAFEIPDPPKVKSNGPKRKGNTKSGKYSASK
ncbi:hypothetical protein MBLNU230_g5081t1 [Neophaeotheca triangularis]